eukprot:TRINITY_DN1010_c0_g1_i1.p1 TRINITY_DN1010_c0_g1~~TRINITY_DN1010_c0_g1_i1.p1  ORF type:complete len:314 (+),score=57.79 TRINITY_DN1010_c0_g1_i1:25-966(+)
MAAPEWDEGWLTGGDGLRIHYCITKTQEGSPVKPFYVFIHGLVGCSFTHIPVQSFLAEYLTVVLPDGRGHGLSQGMLPGSHTMENMVADAVVVVKHFASKAPNGKVLLGGHSMGGATAARVAKEVPELIMGLYLEDPPWIYLPGESPDPDRKGPNPFAKSRELKQEPEEEVRKMRGMFNFLSEEELQKFPKAWTHLMSLRAMDVDVIEPTFKSTDFIINTAVPGITVPLLLHTSIDLPDDDEDLPEAAQAPGKRRAPMMKGVLSQRVLDAVLPTYPSAQHVNFPGAGHHIHASDYRETWQQDVESFLVGLTEA